MTRTGHRLASTPLVLVPALGSYAGSGQAGEGPRLDFLEITRALEGQLCTPTGGRGLLAVVDRVTARLGQWRLAASALPHHPSVVVSLAEKTGMAVALVHPRRTPQVVVAHRLTTGRRRAFQQATGWLRRVDRVVVLSRPQEAYLRNEVTLPPERVRFVYDKVDHHFFRPSGEPDEGYVLSVGQAGRDHSTLLRALAGLSVPAVLVASSSWGAEVKDLEEVPPNVTLQRGVSFDELRRLYDRCSLVVVPLMAGLEFAAGVNVVLETMAMGKPLVVTATPGLAGYIEDGATGRLVPPGDPGALRSVIRELLDDRSQAQALGSRARHVVEAGRNLDTYVATVAAIAREVIIP